VSILVTEEKVCEVRVGRVSLHIVLGPRRPSHSNSVPHPLPLPMAYEHVGRDRVDTQCLRYRESVLSIGKIRLAVAVDHQQYFERAVFFLIVPPPIGVRDRPKNVLVFSIPILAYVIEHVVDVRTTDVPELIDVLVSPPLVDYG
jgi:hypothetical protein